MIPLVAPAAVDNDDDDNDEDDDADDDDDDDDEALFTFPTDTLAGNDKIDLDFPCKHAAQKRVVGVFCKVHLVQVHRATPAATP